MENDLLARLKLIGKIKQNDKLNVKKMYIQPDSIISRLSRSFIFIDDRENTLLFIINTIEKCFDLIHTRDKKVEDENDPRTPQILGDLKTALEGVINLKKTYKEDLFFCCKIDVLVEETEMKIKAIYDKKQYAQSE